MSMATTITTTTTTTTTTTATNTKKLSLYVENSTYEALEVIRWYFCGRSSSTSRRTRMINFANYKRNHHNMWNDNNKKPDRTHAFCKENQLQVDSVSHPYSPIFSIC
uniref:Uncharacterized protein n=1 Tax=Glossina palpalis gambiensis TaxID=67801 RepID=A0A1B0BHT6_9MUSC